MPDVTTMTCEEIINAIPTRFQPEGAGEWKAVIQFKLSGPKGGEYFLTVENKTCTASKGVAPKPTATITAKDETWLGVIAGKIDGQMAFMTGQVQIQGNIADIMKMRNPKIFKQS